MRTFLTEEERSKVLELRATNVSIYNISRQLHRSKNSVSRFLNNPEDYVKEMEAYLTMPKQQRSAPRARPVPKPIVPTLLKKFLTEAEREKINALKEEGRSVTNIATLIGRGSSTIKTYLNNPDGYEELINNAYIEQSLIKKKPPTILSTKLRLKVLELRQTGLSPSKIARKTRKPHESIAAFLKNPDNYDEIMLKKSSTPKKEFQNKINGINEISLPLNRTPVRRYLTETERSKILEMRNENVSMKDISRLIHRGIETIRKFLKNPIQYTDEVVAYEQLKANKRKKPRKPEQFQSYKSLNETIPEEDLKNFNKLSIEYRSIIKYLVKKGNSQDEICNELVAVYGKSAPNLNLVPYWVEQFQQGRETIVNDPRVIHSLGSSHRQNGIMDDNKGDHSSNGSAGGGGGGGNNNKRPPVKLKLFQIKFKPLKRPKEE